MPTALQYEIVKQQCNSFESIGCIAKFKIYDAAPAITIYALGKSYKFCDPDWNVVSMQLSKLFMTIKRKLKC